jgi:hypothetical protein
MVTIANFRGSPLDRTPFALWRPLAATLLFGLMSTPMCVVAATIPVTSPNDTNVAAATTCTLRQAILTMNTGSVSGNCTATNGTIGDHISDTIIFAAAAGNTITLADAANNQLTITATHLTIDGSSLGGVTITRSNGAAFGILYDSAPAGSSLSLIGLTISNGKTSTNTCSSAPRGGGICSLHADLSLTRSTVSNNASLTNISSGGGIYAGGNVVLIDSTVSGNTTDFNGGGIHATAGSVTLTRSTISNNTGTNQAGGILSDTGAVTLIDSTISGNNGGGFGGGVRTGGGGAGSLTVTNSTISGNTAGYGGGIFVNSTPFTLTHVTLVGNNTGASNASSPHGDQLMVFNPNGNQIIQSSIIANPTGLAGTHNAIGAQFGSVPITITGGNNLLFNPGILVAASFATAPSSGDPKLLALADNGGPTKTMALGAGSAAIDAAESGDSFNLGTDQRGAGFVRAWSASGIAKADIGAFEAQAFGGCGTANGVAVSAAPAAALCASGAAAPTVGGTGPWTWTCQGADPSSGAPISASCSAPALPFATALSLLVSDGSSGNPLTSSAFGEPIKLTATLSGNPTQPPTGSITFCDGGNPDPANVSALCGSGGIVLCSAVAIASGTAVCMVPQGNLGIGNHAFAAVYVGDTHNTAGSAVVSPFSVVVAATTTTIDSSFSAPIPIGGTITVQASVAVVPPGAGVPSGTVAIDDGGTGAGDRCTITLPATSCALTPSSVGTKALTATYAGDGNFNPSSGIGSVQIVAAMSSTQIGSSVNPSVFGQSVAFTATVTSAANAPAPTGTITFLDGATSLATIGLINGQAQFATTALAAGPHSMTAIYSGDANTNGSVSAVALQTVNRAATTTTLSPPSAITLGATLSIAATVSANPPGTGTPTGTLVISDGGSGAGDQCTIVLPATSCSLTPSSAGSKTLTAAYSPDAAASVSFASSSATGSLTVNPAASSMQLVSNANPSVFGQTVTFTATVTTASGGVLPTGSVTFKDGGTDLSGCTAAPLIMGSTNAAATCTTSALSVAAHAITASYAGDGNNQTSSAALTQNVDAAATTTTIQPPGSIAFGATLTVQVAVAAQAPGVGTPTGTVTISDGSANCSALLVNGNGSCTLTPRASAGNHVISAVYTATSNFAASTGSAALTVNAATSGVALASSTSSSVFGESVILTATIASANASASGTVAFAENGNALPGCGATAIGAGVSTCSINSLPVGTHPIVATYSGDADTSGSASSAFVQTIVKASTATTLTPVAAITLGNQVSVSAMVAVTAPGGGTPTGTIAIGDGGSGAGDTCTITLPATSCSLTPSTAGNKTLTAVYTPDAAAIANFNGSQAAPGNLTVNAAASGTALSSTTNPSVFGENVSFTATVTPASGPTLPTGTVTFSDGSTTLCDKVALNPGSGNASATCASANLAVGIHAISAAYSGDGNNQPSSATLNAGQRVDAAATTTTIAPLGAIALGDALTVQVAVAVQAPGAGTPSGTVIVRDGSASCSITLGATGAGSCTLTPPAPAGSHVLSATYTATANFASSTASAALLVQAASTGTTLTSSANPSVVGQNVVLTATITPTGGNPTPTGTIDFSDGGTALPGCSGIHLSNGTALCNTSSLSVGSHTIQASYTGDSNAAPSNATLKQDVHPAATTLTIQAPANIARSQAATVTASIAVTSPGSGTPTGTIIIGDGDTGAGDICTIELASATTCTLVPTRVGTKTLTATYAGDANFTGSSGIADLTVVAATSSMTLTSTPNPSTLGQSVTFIARVAASASTGTHNAVAANAAAPMVSFAAAAAPTGTVRFSEAGNVLASVNLDEGGQASYSTTALTVGSHTITASYMGDSNHAAATISEMQQIDAVIPPPAIVPAPALSFHILPLLGLLFILLGAGHMRMRKRK